jgi:predicted RNase H-like HicB family nuclease
MKTYLFRVELEQEDDGRWSAWIESLPGCAAWGYSKEEALEAIKETAQAYLEILAEQGQPIPARKAVETIEAPGKRSAASFRPPAGPMPTSIASDSSLDAQVLRFISSATFPLTVLPSTSPSPLRGEGRDEGGEASNARFG